MDDHIKEDLDYIISNNQIRTVFQPIISLTDGSILGHEALSRITCDCGIKDPETLFRVAEDYNRIWSLEQLCRTTALEAAYKYMIPPYNKKLFINVNPDIMHDENFKDGFTRKFLEQYKIKPRDVIFEITERKVIADMTAFKATIKHYRSQDFSIAIDDAGAGYSGLNLICDVDPDYIKLDMKLIRDVDTNPLKAALIRGMVEVSKVSNIQLIAEGIETDGELGTLVDLGVQYGQGYRIQKPDTALYPINPELLQRLKEINLKKLCASNSTLSSLSIENLCKTIGTVSPDEMVPKVYDSFKRNPSCFGICVLENGLPVGIVTQEKLTYHLSGYYGFALNQNKPISNIMDRYYLSVDCKTPVSLVSSMAMSRPNNKLYDFIVITKEEKYIGVVTIKDLLQKTTEMEVAAAKHQSPLTGLPGNIVIHQLLRDCIADGRPYSVAYLDIDNFKAFNDVYGFEKGDAVIKKLAEILKSEIPEDQFIGHIGGDDFVVIYNRYLPDGYFEGIKDRFHRDALRHYNTTDLQNGYIVTANRRGETERFPLLTLTAVVTDSRVKAYKDPYELTETLAGMKKAAKQKK